MKIFGITGWKNSGKTTLVERLVANMTARGLTVATVKHAHHTFDVDQSGKDSHRHRAAGARQVLISSRSRWALMTENNDGEEPPLAALLPKLDPVDLVLIEGFKRDRHNKIEARRAVTAQDLIAATDSTVLAIASDAPKPDSPVPVFDLDDIDAIAAFILKQTGLCSRLGPHAGEGSSAGAPSSRADAFPPTALPDDCFALPPGMGWVPVEDALQRLRVALRPVAGVEHVPVEAALGRILAEPVAAARAHPPAANAAVDGYGYAHASISEPPHALRLAHGRSAAGQPHLDPVPPGHAIRILTGALIPPGVDTVVLQEDVELTGEDVSFKHAPKAGANTRAAGEDVAKGAIVLPQGRHLLPADIAVCIATGVALLPVRRRLRVGVLSTGDELHVQGAVVQSHQTFDANRPMLLALLRKWDFQAVDLGIASDAADAVREKLDHAAGTCDAILTSGGASAGDEDHVSQALRAHGALDVWRIAMKPGRPLALGKWKGVPVFGLPGNPVAAFVCSLVFVQPALRALAGAPWEEPRAFMLPAGFSKTKRPGRREYLRARLGHGNLVEVFSSEGSGRVSGLSWAQGLVELPDQALVVQPGDLVRYIPFSSFGL